MNRAETVVICGYSVPISDLAVGALLSEAVLGHTVRFAVADYEPAVVTSRLCEGGITRSHPLTFDGATAMQACAEWADQCYALSVPERLRTEIPEWTQTTPHRPIVIRPTMGGVAIVRQQRVVGDSLVLQADRPTPPNAAEQALSGVSSGDIVSSAQLLATLGGRARIARICAEWDGHCYRVLGGLPMPTSGPLDPHWFNLMVQASPFGSHP